MHCYGGNPSKLLYICIFLIPPKWVPFWKNPGKNHVHAVLYLILNTWYAQESIIEKELPSQR